MKSRLALAFLFVFFVVLMVHFPVVAAPDAIRGPFLPLVARDYTGVISGRVTLLEDGFETDDAAWAFIDRNGAVGGDYLPARSACTAYTGLYSAWLVGGGADGGRLPCGANYPNNAESWMIYGPFSLTGATSAEAKWRLWFDNADGNGVSDGSDQFCYLSSNHYDSSNDQGTWHGECLSVPTGAWSSLTYDFRGTDSGVPYDFRGEPEVWLAFRFVSDDNVTHAFGAYVDDVVIAKCTNGACPPLSTPAAQTAPARSSVILNHIP